MFIRLDWVHAVDDSEVWQYAKANDFVIVSKDADFSDMSLLLGQPPKLIWLRIGNCTTPQIEQLIRANFSMIEQMQQDPTIGVLSLF